MSSPVKRKAGGISLTEIREHLLDHGLISIVVMIEEACRLQYEFTMERFQEEKTAQPWRDLEDLMKRVRLRIHQMGGE